jgi:hypothetical protein
MLLLASLSCLSASTWWNFTSEEFEEKKRNSFQLPVFVVCYSHWCPHCSGLPEGTVQYSESDGNRSDVLVTMIDCADRGQDCGHFHISGTPHMVLVIGPKRKYWPRVYSRVGTDWNIFIDKYVKSSLREITTDEELLAAKREPADGGTTFHLETPSADSALIQQLANFSKAYRIYNDTFTYRVNRKLGKPVLTAHVSPHCSATWRSGPLKDFLEKYRFGSRHQYDQDEYRLQSRHSRMALLVVEEGLIGGQGYALENLPKGFCDNLTFGWFSAKDSKHLLKEFRQNTSDLPFIVYSDAKKCRAFNKGRASEADSSGFLTRALNGELCGKVFLNGRIRTQNGTFERIEQGSVVKPLVEHGLSGLKFSAAYVLGGLLLISIIRSRIPDEEGKQE